MAKYKRYGKGRLFLFLLILFLFSSCEKENNELNAEEANDLRLVHDAPVIDQNSPYVFFDIGSISTKTKDGKYSITVEMVLAYSPGDRDTQASLVSRHEELRDFVQNYFSNKYAIDLQPEKEGQLKEEILETLNSEFYQNISKINRILFSRLDVITF